MQWKPIVKTLLVNVLELHFRTRILMTVLQRTIPTYSVICFLSRTLFLPPKKICLQRISRTEGDWLYDVWQLSNETDCEEHVYLFKILNLEQLYSDSSTFLSFHSTSGRLCRASRTFFIELRMLVIGSKCVPIITCLTRGNKKTRIQTYPANMGAQLLFETKNCITLKAGRTVMVKDPCSWDSWTDCNNYFFEIV